MFDTPDAYQETLLADIAEFLRETGITEATFGQKAALNRHFVKQLRSGGRVTLRVIKRVRDYMTRERARLAAE